MRLIFTCFVFIILINILIKAQYSAIESFDYPAGANAYIDNMGTADNGWAGPWTLISGEQDSMIVVDDSGFRYSDLNYNVPNIGNHVTGISHFLQTRYSRTLSSTWPDEAGRIYWISFLMDIKNATATECWLGIKFYNGSSGEIMMFGKGWGMDVFTVGSGAHSGAGPEVSTISWEESPVWIVGKIIMSGDAQNEKVYMWIDSDPAGTEPDTINAAARCYPTVNSGFNTIRMEFGTAVIDGLEVNFDEIRLGTSFAEVSSPLVDVETEDINPDEYSLSQNYPNPFNPTTSIDFTIPEAGLVSIKVYNLIGQEIADILNEHKKAGSYTVDFNAEDLLSGVYFYKIKSGNYSQTKKMILIK